MQRLFNSRTMKPAPSLIGHDPTVLWTNLLVHGNNSNWKSPYKDLRPWCDPQIVPRLASRFKKGNVLQIILSVSWSLNSLRSHCQFSIHWRCFAAALFFCTLLPSLGSSSASLCIGVDVWRSKWRNSKAESLWIQNPRYAFSSFKDFLIILCVVFWPQINRRAVFWNWTGPMIDDRPVTQDWPGVPVPKLVPCVSVRDYGTESRHCSSKSRCRNAQAQSENRTSKLAKKRAGLAKKSVLWPKCEKRWPKKYI